MATIGSKTLTPGTQEYNEAANQIWRGVSPFQNGATFTVTGWELTVYTIDGKESKNSHLTLKTSIGSLDLRTLFRIHFSRDNKPVSPSGTVVDAIKQIVGLQEQTNQQLGEAIVNQLRGRQIRVTRIPYLAINSSGDFYPTASMQLDFVNP